MTTIVETLHSLPTFSELADDALNWLVEHSSEVRVDSGDTLFAEGAPAEYFYVLLEGEIEIVKLVGGDEVMLIVHHPGAFTGEIPLLVGTPAIATARAVQLSRLLQVDKESFEQLLVTCPPLRRVVFSVLAQRLQTTEGLLRERERMASLGTLSAGLAHELNNPAAAAGRATGQLRETVQSLQSLSLKLGAQPLHTINGDIPDLAAIQGDAIERAAHAPVLDSLTQSDREEELIDWLDDHEIDESWRIAPTLAQAGIDPAWLDHVTSQVAPDALNDVLTWLEATLSVANLLNEVENSTARISELVTAVKSYSYMDQAPSQEIDVHTGIENTLTILGHRLKTGITVTRTYDKSLPHIMAYGSELNQVWTNIIDNAIDALDGKGTISIRTSRENDHILVEIADNGPGIPRDIQSRIWEPFFTTKGVGKGSGLGLDIAYRIVVSRHHGDIRVASEPGNTCLEVRLPIH